MKTICLMVATWALAALVFAADPTPTPRPTDATAHAPMEVFGVGPEMFGNRGVAWAKNIGAVFGEIISQFGIQAAAVLLLIQNLANKKRLDNQRQDINHIAEVANIPPTTLPSQQAKVSPPTP